MDEIEHTYDGKFEGNILVGRTACGKTTFVQNLGKNNLFGDISEVYWLSKIALSEEREDAIRDSFLDQEVHFNYPANLEDFNCLIENFMQVKSNYVNSESGEEMVTNHLIVMDDISGLADKSDGFADFLTVSRKYGFSCLYVFHTIYPNRQNWEMILSQKRIFNFFPGSIHSGKILKTLFLFASRYRGTYVPSRSVWLNKLYIDISNSKQKQCLTIDTRTINDLGPGKFRTLADNGFQQICCYNRNKSDTSFNSSLATRKQTSQKDQNKFSINKIITNLNNSNVTYLTIKNELKNIDNDNFQSKLQQLGGGNTSGPSNKKRAGGANDGGQSAKHRRVSKKPRFLSG